MKKEKVTYISPIDSVSGKIGKKTRISYRTTYGKKHMYVWDPETVIRETPGRLIHREAMAAASFEATQIIASPEQKAQWEALAKREKYAGTLIGFIIGHRLPDIKAELKAQWADRPIEDLKAYIKKTSRERFRAKTTTITNK